MEQSYTHTSRSVPQGNVTYHQGTSSY